MIMNVLIAIQAKKLWKLCSSTQFWPFNILCVKFAFLLCLWSLVIDPYFLLIILIKKIIRKTDEKIIFYDWMSSMNYRKLKLWWKIIKKLYKSRVKRIIVHIVIRWILWIMNLVWSSVLQMIGLNWIAYRSFYLPYKQIGYIQNC